MMMIKILLIIAIIVLYKDIKSGCQEIILDITKIIAKIIKIIIKIKRTICKQNK